MAIMRRSLLPYPGGNPPRVPEGGGLAEPIQRPSPTGGPGGMPDLDSVTDSRDDEGNLVLTRRQAPAPVPLATMTPGAPRQPGSPEGPRDQPNRDPGTVSRAAPSRPSAPTPGAAGPPRPFEPMQPPPTSRGVQGSAMAPGGLLLGRAGGLLGGGLGVPGRSRDGKPDISQLIQSILARFGR